MLQQLIFSLSKERAEICCILPSLSPLCTLKIRSATPPIGGPSAAASRGRLALQRFVLQRQFARTLPPVEQAAVAPQLPSTASAATSGSPNGDDGAASGLLPADAIAQVLQELASIRKAVSALESRV